MSDVSREGVFAPQIDEIVGFVSDRLSVHVVGPHGSGRSEILDLVSDRLDDDGWTVHRLYGNPAWLHEPFGALAAAGVGPGAAGAGLGAASPGTHGANPGGTGPLPPRRYSADIAAALAERLRGTRVVVICDDADDLDVSSIGALVTVHQQRRFVAVTTSRPHLPLSPDSLMLGIRPSVRLRTPLLDIDQVHALCRSILDGPVDASALAQITMKSGGLPGLVRAIATVGRRAGTLRFEDGVWRLRRHLWTEHLASAVEHYLTGVEADTWEAATLLALAGPVQVGEAEKLVDRPALDRLFAAGLVHHIDDGAAGVVGLFPPLLADYLRREGSPFGLTHLRAAGERGDLLLHSVYNEAGGFDPGQAVGADAAVMNQRMAREASRVAEAANRVWQADASPEAALTLVTALRGASATRGEIEYVIEQTTMNSDTEAVAILVCWHAIWRATDYDDAAGARAILTRFAPMLPTFAPLLELVAAHVGFLRERVPPVAEIDIPTSAGTDVASAAASPAAAPSGSGVVAQAEACVRAEMLLSAGMSGRARAVLAAMTPKHPIFVAETAVLTGLADILDGDLHAGITFATNQLLAARDNPRSLTAQGYVAALGLQLSGRLGDASQLLFRTLSMVTVAASRDLHHTGLLVIGAEIAIAQGRSEYGRALAAQALAINRGRGPYPGMDASIVAGLLAPASTADTLWPHAAERLDHGYVAVAILLAADAVERTPDLARATEIHHHAAATESPLLRAIGDYVLAAAEGDEAALGAVADQFEALGAGLFRIRAGITRALVLRSDGRSEEASEQAARSWEISVIAGYDRAGLFGRLRRDVGLSAREVEILSMISAHRSNLEVAAELQMSARTVETHLHNVTRKIGVAGREALVEAATTWLRPPQQ